MERSIIRRAAIAIAAPCLAVAGLAATGLAGATSASAAPSAATCAPVVVITARGTGEVLHKDALNTLGREIQNKSKKGVRVQALNYPATAANYRQSVLTGTTNLRADLNALAAKCPKTNIAVLGYSQGAQVVGATLDGGGPQVSAKAKAAIKAVILYGDPAFNAKNNWDRGTFRKGRSGLIPEPAPGLITYASKIQSYCDANDEFCQAGGTSLAVHQGYFAKYNNDAAKFVVSKTG